MPKKHLWPENASCLLVADATLRDQLGDVLGRAGLRSKAVASDNAAVTALEREPFSVAVIAHSLGPSAISSVIARANRRHPDVPVIVLGSTSTVEEAVDVMRRGAADYLPPPVDSQMLLLRLQRLLERPADMAEPRSQPKAPEFSGLVGGSAAMTRTYATIEKISRYKTNVLLLGESGTGKELIARALHCTRPAPVASVRAAQLRDAWPRAPRERALRPREGRVHGRQRAQEGTVRACRRRHALPRRNRRDGPVHAGQAAARARAQRVPPRRRYGQGEGRSQRDRRDQPQPARSRSRSGRFREDLYYRLKVVTVVVPPLRERREDIPALIDSFIADFNRRNNGKIKGISPQLLTRFMEHYWRGNVRELKNAVESAAILAQDSTLDDAETLRNTWPTRPELGTTVEEPGAHGATTRNPNSARQHPGGRRARHRDDAGEPLRHPG